MNNGLYLLVAIFCSLCAVGIFLFIVGLVKKLRDQPPTIENPKPQKATTQKPKETAGYKSTFGSWTCTHGPYGSPKMLTILGKPVGVGSSPFCEKCTIEYFNKYATKCDVCGDAICPGMPVGQHHQHDVSVIGGYKLVTTCQKMDCALPGNLVGQWGEGQVLPMNWGKGSGTPIKQEGKSPEEPK
jgi:hypothetical protein